MSTIIISRTDKIGDLVLSIPSFFMVRKIYPEAKIIVLVRSYNYEIVKHLPYIDHVLKIDMFEFSELKRTLKNYHPDIFIALYSNKHIAALARASHAKIRIGPLSKLSSYFSYNKGIRQKRSQSLKNEGEYNLDLVKLLNPEAFEQLFEIKNEIHYKSSNKKMATDFLTNKQLSSNTLLINPFMGGSAKNITDKQYQNLIVHLLKSTPTLNIIITAHINDTLRAEELISPFKEQRVHLFINKGDLLNLVALIDQVDLYLGGSTGPTHIAGSLNKKIVAIYPNKKTQHPNRWGVLGSQSVIYIIPDFDNPNEDYSIPYFQTYNEKTEQQIVDAIHSYLI